MSNPTSITFAYKTIN